MTILLLLNGFIITMLYGDSKHFTFMTKNQCKNQKKTAKILLAIVAIYLVCHVPALIFKLLFYLGSEDEEFRKKWYFISPIKKLALIINSSVNFVIYCLVGSKLRGEFLRLFGFKMKVESKYWSATSSLWRNVRSSSTISKFELE